jgi:hypothetical protein
MKSLNDNSKSGVNIEKLIENAMQEPLMQEFSSACLKIVQDKSDLNE